MSASKAGVDLARQEIDRRARRAVPEDRNGHTAGEVAAPVVDPAEQSVIGSLLLGAPWATVGHRVYPEDYDPRHRLILEAIKALTRDGAQCDAVTVSERLDRTGHLAAAGGLAYLSEVARNTPTAANVVTYARAVRERALRRHAQELLDNPRVDSAHLVAGLDHDLSQLRELAAGATQLQPLALESAATWAEHAAPAPRDWVIEGLIPAARVTSFLGNGGLGKTIIASQLAVHVATGRRLFGFEVNGGSVVGIFCEDERDELERRIRAAAAGEQLDLAQLERLYPVSRDGMDNLLCTFDRDQIVLTSNAKATIRSPIYS